MPEAVETKGQVFVRHDRAAEWLRNWTIWGVQRTSLAGFTDTNRVRYRAYLPKEIHREVFRVKGSYGRQPSNAGLRRDEHPSAGTDQAGVWVSVRHEALCCIPNAVGKS